MNEALGDMQRRMGNLIALGTVEEADFSTGKVRVRMGGILTDWLPMGGQRAGAVRSWSPLTVGEQVIVLSPSGSLNNGVAIPGCFSESNPSPGSTGSGINVVFPDGSTVNWDGGTLDFQTAGAVKIKAASIEMEAGTITIKGPVSQSGGDITATTDVIGGGISLKNHKHGGVSSGGSLTAPPS